MNVAINKEAFKNILTQFKGDIPFQTELLQTLFDQLPDNYVDEIINVMYLERLYSKPYFKIQHSVYSMDVKYFRTIEDVVAYLNTINISDISVKQSSVQYALKNGGLCNGYRIYKMIGKTASDPYMIDAESKKNIQDELRNMRGMKEE